MNRKAFGANFLYWVDFMYLQGDSHIWTLDKSHLFLFPNLSIGSKSVAYNSNRAKRLSLHCLLQSLRCCSSTPTIGGMKGNNLNYKNILTKYLNQQLFDIGVFPYTLYRVDFLSRMSLPKDKLNFWLLLK